MKGRVFKIFSDFYYVETEAGIIEAKLRAVLKKQKAQVFTGDIVELESTDSDSKQAFICKVVERKNLINRPKVANVSQVIIVSAFKEPDLDFEQTDRYIAHCEYHKIKPVLCFNKEDINDFEDLKNKIEKIYVSAGYRVIYTSALNKSGLDELRPLLKNNTSVLCGSSGVGKSSLINAILNNARLRTLSVSDKTKRGVHTTRHCELIAIDSNSFIADTPGFSHLKFDFLLPYEIQNLFVELKNKEKCKYKNCLHTGEPGCSLESLIEKIPTERYESYKKFVSEAKEYERMISKKSVKNEENTKYNNNRVMTKISSKKRTLSRKTLNQSLGEDDNDKI